MIDIHTHIIPNIDDGAKTMEETHAMLEKAKSAGFTDIIATSHYMENQYEVEHIKRQSVVEALNRVMLEKRAKSQNSCWK